MSTLNVHSIFKSVSGEVGKIQQGDWAVFLRLAGCNLRCSYCDTKRSQKKESGTEKNVKKVLKEILKFKCDNLIITGGEPLLQEKEMYELISLFLLSKEKRIVQVETNGSIAPEHRMSLWEDCNTYFVVDYKSIGSGMNTHMKDFITRAICFPRGTWVKFVVTNKADYLQAKKVMFDLVHHPLYRQSFNFAFSACSPLSHNTLFKRMKKDNVKAVFNVQIHKVTNLHE